MIRRWWIGKYKLPATHQLFQSQSLAELLLEFYEDMHSRRTEIEHDLNESVTGQERSRLLDALGAIKSLIRTDDETDPEEFFETGDLLIDRWERQLARGEIPDLNETMEVVHGRS